MTRLMMLDSGAFSVAHAGAEVKLDDYIAFCELHPDCSYYVNLDVIPTRKRGTLYSGLSLEDACAESFANFRRMTKRLPIEKVIPVFHRSDPMKWLHKYLDMGCPYVGVAPGHNTAQTIKRRWLDKLCPIMLDRAGRPLVKIHGFAVTSFDLMKFWRWESVDSSSWKLQGAWGGIYVPKKRGGEFVFSETPTQWGMSPRAPSLRDKFQHHFENATSSAREWVSAWLDEAGVPLGTFDLKTVKDSYKLSREREEVWYDKAKRVVLVPIEKGATTAVEERLRVNAAFIKRANVALKDRVRHIYFAGALMPYPLEYQLGRRLLSFAHLTGKAAKRRFAKHLDMVRTRKARK